MGWVGIGVLLALCIRYSPPIVLVYLVRMNKVKSGRRKILFKRIGADGVSYL